MHTGTHFFFLPRTAIDLGPVRELPSIAANWLVCTSNGHNTDAAVVSCDTVRMKTVETKRIFFLLHFFKVPFVPPLH